MSEFERNLSLSIEDLKKVKKRVDKMIRISFNIMDILEHEAERCWENPGAEEKDKELSIKMENVKQQIASLSSVSEEVDKLIIKLDTMCL